MGRKARCLLHLHMPVVSPECGLMDAQKDFSLENSFLVSFHGLLKAEKLNVTTSFSLHFGHSSPSLP